MKWFGKTGEIEERLERLDLPFNRYGLDPYGISKKALKQFYSMLSILYRHYFRVSCTGLEHIPAQGPVMLVGNHSGGLPVDGGMVIASMFLDHEPPRHVHAMVEYFAQKWPFLSTTFSRIGQFSGLPHHAMRILREGRVLLVFPEGARGTGKLYRDRYRLERFGTGFLRLALCTQATVIPFAFIGGEEAIPTLFHLKRLAKWMGAPYIPVPPQLLPIPLPVSCQIHYGKPLTFEGGGNESDEVMEKNVQKVRAAIEELIEYGLSQRRKAFDFGWGRRTLQGDRGVEEEQS